MPHSVLTRTVFLAPLFLVNSAEAGQKPGELPVAPMIEFRVLSDYAQEYYQEPIGAPISQPTLPSKPQSSIGVAVASLSDKNSSEQVRLKLPALPAFAVNRDFSWNPLETVERDLLVRQMYEVAETFRNNGNTQEATRWYRQICQSFPHSPFAVQAADQLRKIK